jgi:hypothetical protein
MHVRLNSQRYKIVSVRFAEKKKQKKQRDWNESGHEAEVGREREEKVKKVAGFNSDANGRTTNVRRSKRQERGRADKNNFICL